MLTQIIPQASHTNQILFPSLVPHPERALTCLGAGFRPPLCRIPNLVNASPHGSPRPIALGPTHVIRFGDLERPPGAPRPPCRSLVLWRSRLCAYMELCWLYLQADSDKTSIQGYDRFGFNVNGIFMRGSVICFPTFTLLWDAQSIKDATPESLAPVYMVKPRISALLVLSVGWVRPHCSDIRHRKVRCSVLRRCLADRNGRGNAQCKPAPVWLVLPSRCGRGEHVFGATSLLASLSAYPVSHTFVRDLKSCFVDLTEGCNFHI